MAPSAVRVARRAYFYCFLQGRQPVVSPEPFERKPITLRIRYEGKRDGREVGSANFFCESFGWCPSYGSGLNSFADRSDFDITLRVPKRYYPVAVGTMVGNRKGKDYRITRWKSDLSLAVAGFAYGDYKIDKKPLETPA